MRRTSGTTPALGAVALVALASCTIRDTGEARGDRPAVTFIEVTPSSAVVQPGGKLPYRAIVTGTGKVPGGVVWTIGEPWSGRSVPKEPLPDASEISIPSTPPSETRRTKIYATSVVDKDVWGTADIEIPAASVAIEPAQPEAVLGETLQLRAIVNGTTDPRVEWGTGWCPLPGDVDATGLYRAPEISADGWECVSATSPATRATASVTVRLVAPPPVLTGTSGPALPGEDLTIFGSGLYRGFPIVRVIFEDALGQPVEVTTNRWTVERALKVTVPPEAATGSVRVALDDFYGRRAVSNAVPFEVPTLLRLHPVRAVVAAGESTRIDVAFLGGTPSAPVAFAATLGAVAGGVYVAPSDVAAPSRAYVQACVAGAAACAGTTIDVVPLRIEPSTATVPAGGTVAFSAFRAGVPVAATFSIASGGGTMTTDGTFTAPTALVDSGATRIAATFASATATADVAVTGLAPGLVHRIDESATPPDPAGVAWGAFPFRIAVTGDRAYVAARPSTGAYAWIDVYDVADLTAPVWLGAVATAHAPHAMWIARDRLYAPWSAGTRTAPTWGVDVFDLSTPLPSLVAASAPVDGFTGAPPVVDADLLYEFGPLDVATATFPVRVRDLSQGALPAPRTIAVGPLPTPWEPGRGFDRWLDAAATVRDGRLWLGYKKAYSGFEWALTSWDASADPPTYLGAATIPWQAGGELQVAGPEIRTYYSCFDRRPPTAQPVPCTVGSVAAADATRALVWTDGALSLLDLADAANPTTPVVLATSGARGFLSGNLFVGVNERTLSIFDVGTRGGMVRTAAASVPTGLVDLWASTVRNGVLYAGGEGTGSGWVGAWDLSASPPTVAWSSSSAGAVRGLAASGDLLLVGTLGALEIHTLADPLAPAPVASVPLDVTAVAVHEGVAWAGTWDGDLVAIDLGALGGPAELGRIRLAGEITAIVPGGPGRVAVALHDHTLATGDLAVVDVSVPSAPAPLATAGLAAPALGLARYGDVAIATTATTFATIDLSDPAAPALLAVVPLPFAPPYVSNPRPPPSAAVDGDLLWVVQYDGSGLGRARAYDMRSPASPRLIAEASLAGLGASQGGFVPYGARAFALGGYDYWRELVELDASTARNVVLPAFVP